MIILKTCPYKHRCKYVTNEDLCNELADNCRIYHDFERQTILKLAKEEERRRYYNLNDVGLVQRLR